MKKIFNVFVIVLFMISFSNASGKIKSAEIHNYDHCSFQASVVEFGALYYGFSPSEAYEMGSNSFDYCVDKANLESAIYWSNN
ncbi:hypothetical protein M8845_10635 [Gelidibacter japonicus]|uniref:hypothetical protein n=1 Tax=Gelidibacter japonicus TaxID=1962232 RepID=UPI0020226170|nr:hypothetical protein [Gelidibacter japonicus]MCL8007882.1 hypothetical protein [Gelidibacter japonicus]